MAEFSVNGRRVTVVGAARSGVAAAELLVRRGARVTLTDRASKVDAAASLARAGVVLELGGHTRSTFTSADLIVVSPGVPLDQPVFEAARRAGVEVIGELELAWRWLRGRTIAITGTKGKSTTTTLIGRMLEAEGRDVLVGGNIGVPLSAQVERSRPESVHVVEVSSFQLETVVTFKPWIAVWLNLSADHLDRHPSFEAYGAAKARILAQQDAGDFAVLNADDAEVVRHAQGARATQAWFSLAGRPQAEVVVQDAWVVRRTTTGVTPLLALSTVELTGRHMLNNVLAATATSALAGVSGVAMTRALAGFRGLEHVMEPVGEIGGVRFVNDSKATNVDAACRSIESFERDVVAIIGGRFKGGDLAALAGPLRDRGRAVVAIGEAAPLVRAALEPVVPVIEARSMAEAVEKGLAAAVPGGVVLLAPACASFDWFADYAARGRAFKAEVERVKREKA